MMYKVIVPGSFDFGSPAATLVDIHSRGVDKGWMTKRAAALTEQIKSLRPEPGYSYIHLISMGAQEAYGCNRNGDGFNEKAADFRLIEPKPGQDPIIKMAGGLKEYHPTFEKYAHVFKHHNNKDPKHAIGTVKASAYNEDMRRGELIIRVPHNEEWNDDLEKLANGKDIPFSMACKVAYDICTSCGNRAATRADYCPHLSDQMTDIVKHGHQVFAINDVPTFFDISKVFKPADRIAYSLQKVASCGLATIGGAELAEMMGVSASPAILIGGGPAHYERKLAAARKLAEIEKTIEGTGQAENNQHLTQLTGACPHGDVGEQEIGQLSSAQLGSALQALGSSQICLSVQDFAKLVMGSKADSIAGDIPKVAAMLPGMYSRLLSSGGVNECAADQTYDPSSTSIPRHVRNLVEKMSSDHSMSSGPADRRLRYSIISGPAPRQVHLKVANHTTVSKQAEYLCKEYAKYQLSFIAHGNGDPVVEKLTVLRNYLTV